MNVNMKQVLLRTVILLGFGGLGWWVAGALPAQFPPPDSRVYVSATNFQLYIHCANSLNVLPLKNDAAFHPVYTEMENGRLIPASYEPSRVLFVPDSKDWYPEYINNRDGSKLELDRRRYRLIHPPKPAFELSVLDKPGIRGGRYFKFRVVPDEKFAMACPDDARYVARRLEVMGDMHFGNGTYKIINLSGQDLMEGVTFHVSRARLSRGHVTVKLNDLMRINFEGRRVPIPLTDRERIIIY